jgi:hypothetical protein
MSDLWFGRIVVIVCSVLGSGGFWAFLQVKLRKRDTRRDATTRLMMGLAQAQISTLGLEYIDRGSVTHDEYENMLRYLYEPYQDLGGNGSTKRLMRDVGNLPFRSHIDHSGIFQNREDEGWNSHVRVVRRSEEASAE